MTNKPRKLLLGGFACAALLALSVPAMAIPVNGSATWTGVLTLTNTGVLSFCPPVTPTQTPCPPVSAAGAPRRRREAIRYLLNDRAGSFITNPNL